MMMCDQIKCILKTMMHNVSEAREKINKAHEWKDKDRGVADWFKTMAAGHLEYNSGAMQMVKGKLQEMRGKYGHISDAPEANHTIGKCEAYEEWLEQIGPEAAEVRAMIDGFDR